MTNTNCLEGFGCPNCGADDAFYIEAAIEVLVRDDGTEDQGGDYIWSQDHRCRCAACKHYGRVSDFTVENWTAALEQHHALKDLVQDIQRGIDPKESGSLAIAEAAIARAKAA
jgi:hypothetical protein